MTCKESKIRNTFHEFSMMVSGILTGVHCLKQTSFLWPFGMQRSGQNQVCLSIDVGPRSSCCNQG